jgi:ATP-dependent RNA helicase RhlE
MVFADLGLSPRLLDAVARSGYVTPTPIQAQAIPIALAGRDLIVSSQTGSGKSAAFILPTLQRLIDRPAAKRGAGQAARVLILAPTRELAGQISDCIRCYGQFTNLRSTAIYGGVSQFGQEKALRRGVDLIVATPGRLGDLLRQGLIQLDQIEVLILDEADRMLDMGFLPDVQRIIERLPRDRQTLLFSATIPPTIARLTAQIMSRPHTISLVPTRTEAARIEEQVYLTDKAQKSRLLIELIGIQQVTRAIVFTRMKHGADRLVKELHRHGIRACAFHGNKSQGARQRTLADFRTPNPPLLIATDVAARGIDVDNVSHVFNYDLPGDPETYVHRIGRTGRAGASGTAISFCQPDERAALRDIERFVRRPLAVTRPTPAQRIDQVRTADKETVPARSARAGRTKSKAGSPG